MKTNRLIIGGWILGATLFLSACSTNKQVAYKDDMYNNKPSNKSNEVYQSPDYYYTDGNQQVAQN